MPLKQFFATTCLASCLLSVSFSQPAPVENPDWDLVTSKLDKGGSFYLYTDLETIIESGLDYTEEFLEEVPQQEQIQARMGLTMARTIINTLGLNEFDDLGMSIIPYEDGSGRAVTFLALEETKGLFALRGDEPRPLESMNFIPKDSVMAFSQNMNYDQILPLIQETGTATLGPMASMYIQQYFEQIRLDSGIDLKTTLESIDGELAGWLTLDEIIQLEAGRNTLEIPKPSFAFLVKTKDNSLFKTVETMVARSGNKYRLVEGTPLGDMITMEVKENPIKFNPIFAQQNGWFFFASSSEAYAKSLKAKKNGILHQTSPEFKKLSQGLPNAYNSMTYVSPRFYQEISTVFGKMQNISGKSTNTMDLVTKQTYPTFLSKIKNEHGLLTVRVNDPDGILWVSQGQVNQSSFVQGPLLLAVPLFAAAYIQPQIQSRHKADTHKTRAQMRSLATAIESYYIDSNVYPVSTTDPKQVFTFTPDTPPSIPSFNTYKGSGSAMSLTSPIAYLSAFPEDPFNAGQSFGFLSKKNHYMLFSPGPDLDVDLPWEEYSDLINSENPYDEWILPYTYDPTNGALSSGDIIRLKR